MKNQYKLLVALLYICILSSCSNQEYTPNVMHEIAQIENEKVRLLWSKDKIYTVWSTFGATVDASNNRICFLGGLDSSTDNAIVCMNSINGDVLWQKHSGIHRSIAVTANAIFVVYSSNAGVRKYDTSGKIAWSKHLSGTGSNYLYIVEEQLQILTVPEKFWIIDFEGNEIRNINGEKIFISTPDETFYKLSGIQLRKNNTGEIVWQYDKFDDILEIAPIFTNTKIFVRTGQESGSIFTFDRKTGSLLWKSDNNIIANLAYSPSKKTIYALTRDGKLLAINENNGKTDTIAEFSAVPFILNGEDNVGSYQLAYDPNTYILFVSLGDSRQMFAFKEQ